MSITIATVDPSLTLPALRSIETAFSSSVLHPDVLSALQKLGLDVHDVAEVNIVTRFAAMRSVSPAVAWSTFFNPNPAAINRLIPSSFETASFDTILRTQSDVLDPLFRNGTESMDSAELGELAELCRIVVGAARDNAEGRPLFAGLASLPLPTEDHMMVWHAARLLREHRGDGHIATLVVEGLGRVDALVIHAALMPEFGDGLRRSRRWSIEDWNTSMASLRSRGWLTNDETPTFTPEGSERRQWIETRTDELAAVAFDPIGDKGLARLIELGAIFTGALETGGMGSTLRKAIPMGD